MYKVAYKNGKDECEEGVQERMRGGGVTIEREK